MTAVVLLVGFVDHGAPPPEAPPHRRLPSGSGLDAIVIDQIQQAPDAPEVQAMDLALAQVSILSAYADRHDVLPVALGAAFSGDDALFAHVSEITPRLLDKWRAVAGQCEWLVAIDRRLSGPAVPQVEATGYLRRRQAELRARRDMEAAHVDFVTSVIRALGTARFRLGRPQAGSKASLAVVAALLHRAAVGTVRTRLEERAAEAERLGLTLRLIGPCAPFSFIAAEGPDG